ncbi:hypothetical protein DFH29DRAFT_881232 [Suillus ampliporus]|nr:hypothetical protein DFH29DRAFT_881232 [Suillus ampliporus]
MARRKKTGLKSTGGPAKRGELPRFKKVTRPAGMQVIKNVFPKAKLPRSSQVPTKSDAPKVIPKLLSHNIYCFFCRDGGSLYDCLRCPRSVCHRCVMIPEEFQERFGDPDVHFICPGCHEMRVKHEGNVDIKPYFGFEDTNGTPILTVPATIHGHIEVTSRLQVCSDPILILHFVLRTLNASWSPAPTMQALLWPYIPDEHLQYHELVFDFRMPEKHDKHITMMKQLVHKLQCRTFNHVERPCEVTSGGGFEDDEVVARGKNKASIMGEPVAYTVEDDFSSAGIEDYVRGATLWMLFSCTEEALPVIEELFTVMKLSMRLRSVIAYIDRVLVEALEVNDVMQDLLTVSPRLAMHGTHHPLACQECLLSSPAYHSRVQSGDNMPSCILSSTTITVHWAIRYPTNAPPASHRGTSSVSGKLVKKGNAAGSGWSFRSGRKLLKLTLTHPYQKRVTTQRHERSDLGPILAYTLPDSTQHNYKSSPLTSLEFLNQCQRLPQLSWVKDMIAHVQPDLGPLGVPAFSTRSVSSNSESGDVSVLSADTRAPAPSPLGRYPIPSSPTVGRSPDEAQPKFILGATSIVDVLPQHESELPPALTTVHKKNHSTESRTQYYGAAAWGQLMKHQDHAHMIVGGKDPGPVPSIDATILLNGQQKEMKAKAKAISGSEGMIQAQASCIAGRQTPRKRKINYDIHNTVTNKENVICLNPGPAVKCICREKMGTDWQTVLDVVKYNEEQ